MSSFMLKTTKIPFFNIQIEIALSVDSAIECRCYRVIEGQYDFRTKLSIESPAFFLYDGSVREKGIRR